MLGQRIDTFSHQPNNNAEKVVEDQKSLVLRVYDTGPFNWVGQNMEYVSVMIKSTSKQISFRNEVVVVR